RSHAGKGWERASALPRSPDGPVELLRETLPQPWGMGGNVAQGISDWVTPASRSQRSITRPGFARGRSNWRPTSNAVGQAIRSFWRPNRVHQRYTARRRPLID